MAVVVVLGYGTWAISKGHMTVGSFTSFLAGLFAADLARLDPLRGNPLRHRVALQRAH